MNRMCEPLTLQVQAIASMDCFSIGLFINLGFVVLVEIVTLTKLQSFVDACSLNGCNIIQSHS
jgi:hypothetical protein